MADFRRDTESSHKTWEEVRADDASKRDKILLLLEKTQGILPCKKEGELGNILRRDLPCKKKRSLPCKTGECCLVQYSSHLAPSEYRVCPVCKEVKIVFPEVKTYGGYMNGKLAIIIYFDDEELAETVFDLLEIEDYREEGGGEICCLRHERLVEGTAVFFSHRSYSTSLSYRAIVKTGKDFLDVGAVEEVLQEAFEEKYVPVFYENDGTKIRH